MKKQISSVSFLICMSISGVAFSNPLSGVYTIGGSTPNYATFAAAVSDLTTNGVSGPVIFNVRAGTYNEQVKITYVAGTTSTNTVTFQAETGNASNVTITYGSTVNSNYVVDLDSASYIIFNKITIQSTGTTYSTAINIENNSTYNTLDYLIVTAPVVTSGSTNNILVNMDGDESLSNYNGVYHSTLTGGSYGVYTVFCCYGGASYNYGVATEYNSIVNQYAGGINEVRCLHGATIKYNTITTNSTDTGYNAIKISIEQDTIADNKIYKCPGTGINFNNCSPYICNNFVEIEGSAINYGITHRMDNYCGDVVFVSGNTVLIKNTNSQSAGFYLPIIGSLDFPFNFLRDNIFVNRGGGYAIFLGSTGSVSTGNAYNITPTVDYNDYYTTGAYIGQWGTTMATTLSNWQSTISGCGCGADANSINVNPSFVSDTDLRITVDNVRAGTHAPEEGPKDIDGNIRNVTTPDMGAYEVTVVIQSAQFTASSTTVCSGTSVTFTDQSTGTPLSWKWTFAGGTPDSSTSQNPSILYQGAGVYDVKLVVTFAGGTDSLIKTGYITVNPSPVAGIITANLDTVCSLMGTQLSVKGSKGTVQWQSSANGISFTNISSANDTTYSTPNLTQTTYYRVKTSNSCGADSSASVTINVTPLPVAGTLSFSGRDSICEGTTSLLNINNSVGILQWQSSTDGIHFSTSSGATSNTYNTPTLTQTTYYRLIASSGNCGSDTSNKITVQVLPSSAVNFTYVVNGKQVSFTPDSVSSGVNLYQWDFGDSQTSNDSNPVHTFDSLKTYTVCLTVYNGSNCSFTVCENVSALVTGIESISANQFVQLYPNPANYELSIEVLNAVAPKQIIITDDLSRTLIQLSTYKIKTQIDVRSFSAGIYLVKVQMNDGSLQIRKFVKE